MPVHFEVVPGAQTHGELVSRAVISLTLGAVVAVDQVEGVLVLVRPLDLF